MTSTVTPIKNTTELLRRILTEQVQDNYLENISCRCNHYSKCLERDREMPLCNIPRNPPELLIRCHLFLTRRK